MAILIIVIIGVVAVTKVPIDLYPDLELPAATIYTEYEGASPEEIESRVTKPLEEIVGTVEGVDTINSISKKDASIIVVEFNWGRDMDFATLDLREKVDLIREYLPVEIDDPVITKVDPSADPIMQLGLSGMDDLVKLKTYADDIVKPRIERLPGVASVEVVGGLDREIKVLVDPVKLDSYGLSLSRVINTLRAENLEISGGDIIEGNREYLVRTLGEFENLNQIENMVISIGQGGYIHLKDIAEVKDDFEDVETITYVNGKPSIGLLVYKQSDANTVRTSNLVRRELVETKKYLPGEVQIDISTDQAIFINKSIKNLMKTAMIGALLATAVLYIFLRNFTSTLIIGLAIPLSIISTFNLMYFKGLSMNLISLGGLGIGVGMMVDNSIVSLESIYRYWKDDGLLPKEAAKLGSAEIGGAITGSTLTTVVVFLPIIFVQGMTAQLFSPLAYTVTFSLLSSLFVAITLVPMMASIFFRGKYSQQKVTGNKNKKLSVLVDRISYYIDILDEKYRKALAWSLKHRKAVLVIALLSFMASFLFVPLIGSEFIPHMDSGEFKVEVEMPGGTPIEKTEEVAKQIWTYIDKIPEVEQIFVEIGTSDTQGDTSSNPERAEFNVIMVSRSQRDRSTGEIIDDLRKDLENIPGADIKVTEKAFVIAGFFASAPISISIQGDDLETLQTVTQEIAEEVKKVPGTREVETTFDQASPEIHLTINREKASVLGLNVYEIGQTIRAAVNGEVATLFRTNDDEYDIRVQLKPEYRENILDLRKLTVTSPSGYQVPLSEITEINRGEGPSNIDRENQVRVAYITSEVLGRDIGSITKEIQDKIGKMDIPPGYTIDFSGEVEEMRDSFKDLAGAMILAVILVYMIMAAQFESLLYPLIIMFTIPLTFIGVSMGLGLTGRPLSVPAFLGIIMLAGIVVNNGIVLVDYINTLRKRGLSRDEAILKAGPTRLRPILMTTTTTVLGLLPIALGIGDGAEVQAPMATVVTTGLTTSTLLTLIVIPVLYSIFDEAGSFIKKIKLKIDTRRVFIK
jgi:HAE1 family hydrophobic/amphiphilic exporter-1